MRNNNPADAENDNDNPELDGPAPMPDEMAAPDLGAMASNEICVDLQSLAMPDGETEQMNPPAVGDKVQAAIDGTVTRIEGDKAYLKMDAVNGQEVKENAPGSTDEQEQTSLEQMASGMPDR
jgi:hypothetical protein